MTYAMSDGVAALDPYFGRYLPQATVAILGAPTVVALVAARGPWSSS